MKHCEKSYCVTFDFEHTKTMRSVLLITILSFLATPCFAIPKDLKQYLKSRWKLSFTEEKYLDQGKILTDANVTDQMGIQSFDMQATAWHEKKCRNYYFDYTSIRFQE